MNTTECRIWAGLYTVAAIVVATMTDYDLVIAASLFVSSNIYMVGSAVLSALERRVVK